MSVSKISAKSFSDLVKGGQQIDILDVRTNIECKGERVGCNFISIPLHELDCSEFVRNNKQRLSGKPLYILCRSGGRAQRAAKALEKAGMENMVIVEGGLSACAECNIPIEKSAVWSLERQVRFTAGLLVLGGVLLGHFVSVNFYILAGAIGAGLIFAGITDWCGMAMLLARAPWNNTDSTKAIQESVQSFEHKETTHA